MAMGRRRTQPLLHKVALCVSEGHTGCGKRAGIFVWPSTFTRTRWCTIGWRPTHGSAQSQLPGEFLFRVVAAGGAGGDCRAEVFGQVGMAGVQFAECVA